MKKAATIILLILVTLCCACTAKSDAEASGGGKAEFEAEGFRYAKEDGGIRILDYVGGINEADIPEEVDGFPVRIIEGNAYYEDAAGAIQMLENTWEEAHVVIPAEIDGMPVTVIDGDAFYQKLNMVSIVLPDSLKEIEGGAFYRCYGLETVHIPKSVEIMGGDLFFRCSSLTEITVDGENQNYTAVDGVLYDKNIEVLLKYPEAKEGSSYCVPDTVKEIVNFYGYFNPYITDLYIPASVTLFPDFNIFELNYYWVEEGNPDVEPVILHVEAGSSAEAYAIEYEIGYVVE